MARRGGAGRGGVGRIYLDLPDDELHAPDERDCDLALLLKHASALLLHLLAGLPRGQRMGGWAAGAVGVAGAGDDEGMPLLRATHGRGGRTKVRRMYCWIFRAALLSRMILICANSSLIMAQVQAAGRAGCSGAQQVQSASEELSVWGGRLVVR